MANRVTVAKPSSPRRPAAVAGAGVWLAALLCGLPGALAGCQGAIAGPDSGAGSGDASLAAGGEDGGPAYARAALQEESAAMRSPIVGLWAPDFTLPNQDDKPVTLSKLRGRWVVLYFYPHDDTPGCTCQATEFTKVLSELKGMNASVYGVSEDTTIAHMIFIAKFNLGIDLLSDPNHETMRRYGAWVDYYLGDRRQERAVRSTVLIDPQGVIRYHWPEVIPFGHARRVALKLARLQEAARPG